MKKNLPLILFNNQSDKMPIHLYSDIDKNAIGNLSSLSQLPHLNIPIILLTDVHHKPLMETPSSSVFTTHHYFSPALTSPSQNCGMSLIQTPFSKDDASPLFIDKIISLIKKSIPLKNQAPLLSRKEVLQALMQGARWAVKKYALSDSILNHIEFSGNLLNENETSVSDLENTIPNEVIELSRSRFRIIGGGNHFLELQYVDEIFDDKIAKIWGLQKNQIVIMFHTGSDVLGAYLGRLYAFRKKTGFKHQILFYQKKIKHHLLKRPLKSIPARLSYYFPPNPFRFINPDILEGKRALLAINSSANFGFACRVAILNEINEICKQLFGNMNLNIDLLYDCSHNSIYNETIGGNAVWAHRHNACRVYPPSLLKKHPVFNQTGQPVILPGTNQTSSFICAGQEGAAATHFTVDHGLGAIQKRYEQKTSTKELNKFTLLYNYENDITVNVPILSDSAVNEAVDILNEANIVKTIARLKPLATLKGPKSKVV